MGMVGLPLWHAKRDGFCPLQRMRIIQEDTIQEASKTSISWLVPYSILNLPKADLNSFAVWVVDQKWHIFASCLATSWRPRLAWKLWRMDFLEGDYRKYRETPRAV
jgi:hypothetical protein